MNQVREKIAAGFFLALGMLAAHGCSESVPEADSVRIQLKWTHKAQFAGMYLADRRGFYRDEGFAVEFLEGGADIAPVEVLARGEADLAVVGVFDLALARAAGKPLVAVAAILKQHPAVLITLRERGIHHPRDLAGGRVAVEHDTRYLVESMLARVGVDPKTVIVPGSASLDDLADGKVDAVTGYVTSRVPRARRDGLDVAVIHPQDLDLHTYGDLLVVREEQLVSDPERFRRLVAATVRGWIAAIEEPRSAVEAVLEYAVGLDSAGQMEELKATIPLVVSGTRPVGVMDARRWHAIVTTLVETGVVASGDRLDGIYDLGVAGH